MLLSYFQRSPSPCWMPLLNPASKMFYFNSRVSENHTHLIREETGYMFSISDFERSSVLHHTTTKRLFRGFKEHLLVLMFPRHKVTSASLPACLLLFVQKSAEGRAHWRQRWCHHCDHYCAVRCPIFDQASLRAGQNFCLLVARRNTGLPVLINREPVFSSPKLS